jgi:FHS family L-fucose permease-like MFS transporter
VLGPGDRAAQRISIMGVCNKAAGILAPLLFAAVILRPNDSILFKSLPTMGEAERAAALDELIRRVIVPYVCVGVVLFGLGCLVRYSSLPEIGTEEAVEGKNSLLQFPHLVLGALAIFLHVGTQVLAIDTIIGYAGSMNIPLLEAKVFPSYTLAATIAGYLTGIVCIPRYISQAKAFLVCTLLGIGLSLLVVLSKADHSIWFLMLLGTANSLIWAGIWPLALDGLGRFTKAGASLLVMGLCGNAILPLVYGWLADRNGLQQAYWILLPCYCYLFFYASYGHRIRNWGIFSQ